MRSRGQNGGNGSAQALHSNGPVWCKCAALSARLALLARNHALLKTDLQAAAHILRYFDAAAPAVQSVHDILSELVQASEAATTLNIDASVHAVRQYRSRS